MAQVGEHMKGAAHETVKLPVPVKRLQCWNISMCVFHTIFAIVTLVAGNRDLRVPVYGSGVALNVLPNSTRAWALIPDTGDRAGWLHLTWLVAIFFALSAFAHLGNGLLWRAHYIRALEQAYAPFRWLEYSVSASVMVLILAYTSGTILNPVLVALFGLTFITMAFGHLHEVVCRPKSLQEWTSPSKLWRLQAHLIGYIPQIFAWSLIIAQFMEAGGTSTTDSNGQKRQMPAFVYGIVFGELLIFWSFGLVQLVVTLRPPSRYCEGEMMYMWLSLLAKGFLGLMLLTNVLMAGKTSEIYADDAAVV